MYTVTPCTSAVSRGKNKEKKRKRGRSYKVCAMALVEVGINMGVVFPQTYINVEISAPPTHNIPLTSDHPHVQ